jgi:arylsulfatase A-like enzyme/sugar phosphate isomerase/epimerase
MRRFFLLLASFLALFSGASGADLFSRENLVAWCIVPFDTKKRGPEERAQMLERLGIMHLAYDYRAEHIATFDAELDALARHGIGLTAWWFPTTLNDEAKHILAVIGRHGVHPQLWVTGGGAPVKSPEEQAQRIVEECARIRPIAEAAAKLGLTVGLYNHGGWFGDPGNQLAILEKLALPNVGIVYNFHHGHGEIARFRELWPKMQPRVIALNTNGMVPDGDKSGRGTITIGSGTEEGWMLQVVRDSGWTGPVGIVGDRPQLDAEDALRDNIAGLEKVTAAMPRAERRPPNVVIIFTDDQGYADVGVFGAKGFATPNLDRMAREGRRFTDWHAAQPVCSASRAALLTGCYPNRIGIHGALPPNSKVGISDGEVTLAQLAKSRGYATAIFGKWHLGDRPQFLPTRHGFDEYFGLPYSNDMWPNHPEAKPDTYPPLPIYDGEKRTKIGVTHEDQEQLTTWYAEHAVSFIDRHKAQPFFLYVTPNMPHVPLHVSEKFRGKSERGLYGDVIMEIDWAVGEILAAIKRNGLDENTLVIFTSDNGPWLSYGNHAGSAEPLREGKGTSFDGGHREPFIVRWPGKIPAGTVCTEPAMTIDIFPTVARLIGAGLPAHKIDGLDIWPLFAGESGARNPHEAYFFYYDVNALQAVRSGEWKLFFPHQSRTMNGQTPGHDGIPGKYRMQAIGHELYNLSDDIGETKNIAEQNPEIVKRLEALAEGAREDLGDALTKRVGKGAREPGRWTAEQ